MAWPVAVPAVLLRTAQLAESWKRHSDSRRGKSGIISARISGMHSKYIFFLFFCFFFNKSKKNYLQNPDASVWHVLKIILLTDQLTKYAPSFI